MKKRLGCGLHKPSIIKDGLQTTRSQGRGTDKLLPSSPKKEPTLFDTVISDLWFPKLLDDAFVLFKTTALWYFVMAALANSYKN